jgi:hypothetical protein
MNKARILATVANALALLVAAFAPKPSAERH